MNKSVLFLFYYPLPNNHVLHTLLARLCVELFGNSALLSACHPLQTGVLGIPATYILTRLIVKTRESGFLAAALAAVFPYLILFSTWPGGIPSLSCLACGLPLPDFGLMEKPNLPLCFLFSLVFSLGLLDIPTFLFPAGGIFIWTWIGLKSRGMGHGAIVSCFALPCAWMTGICTLCFYTPVIISMNGVQPLVANRFVHSLTWGEFAARLPGHIQQTGWQMISGTPVAAVILLVFVLIMGQIHLARTKNQAGFRMLPVILLINLLVLTAKHAIPFARNMDFCFAPLLLW